MVYIRCAKNDLALDVRDARHLIGLPSGVELESLKCSLMAVARDHHQVYAIAVEFPRKIGLHPGDDVLVIPKLNFKRDVAMGESAIKMQGSLRVPEIAAGQGEQIVVGIRGEDHAARLLPVDRRKQRVGSGFGAREYVLHSLRRLRQLVSAADTAGRRTGHAHGASLRGTYRFCGLY